MREIKASEITDVVERLCIKANEELPEDIKGAIRRCRACEDWETAQGVLDKIIENFEIAGEEHVPIGAPRQYRRQYAGYVVYGDRSGRADQSNRRPQGLRKRKYERYPDV